jgi:hypothetical protein
MKDRETNREKEKYWGEDNKEEEKKALPDALGETGIKKKEQMFRAVCLLASLWENEQITLKEDLYKN